MSDFSFPFSFQLDSSGNGSFDLTPFFVQTYYQVFNLGANVPGAGTQSTVIQLGSVPYQTSQGSNPQLGPIYVHTQKCLVVVTGGTANAIVQGYIQGAEEDSYDALPNLAGPSTNQVSINGGTVNLSGPVSITGPVTVQQSDPSVLLAGQVGVPLVENVSATIPANSVDLPFPSAVTSYDVAGFGAVYLSGLIAGGANAAVHFQIEWLDSLGNTIDVTGVPGCPIAFEIVVGTQARFMRIHFWNLDITSHALTKFTIIPLVSLPNPQGSILPSIFGAVGAAPNPDPRSIMADDNQSVPGSSNFTSEAFFTYSGPAIWNISNSSGITDSNWWAELRVKFANGTLQSIAHAGNVAMQTGQQVVLPAGHTQVVIHNLATSAANFDNSLMAI